MNVQKSVYLYQVLVYKHHLMIANWSAVWSYDVKFAGLFKIASSQGDA